MKKILAAQHRSVIRPHRLLSLGFFLVLWISTLGLFAAKEIRVPQDFLTVEEAITAAQAGDTILIGPGFYGVTAVVG
jgi:hypothetical protein